MITEILNFFSAKRFPQSYPRLLLYVLLLLVDTAAFRPGALQFVITFHNFILIHRHLYLPVYQNILSDLVVMIEHFSTTIHP